MRSYYWIPLLLFFYVSAYNFEGSSEQIIRYEIPIFTKESNLLRFNNISILENYWEIDFSKSSHAEIFHPSFSLFGKPQKFYIEIWTNTTGCELEFLLGSHFQFFKRSIKITSYGLQTILINAPPEEWEYFGGENDGRVRLPLRFLRLTIRKGSSPSNVLNLRILKFICETELPTTQECILISKIERINDNQLLCKCELSNLLPKDALGTLRCSLRDWQENTLTGKVYPSVYLSAGGEKYLFHLPYVFPGNKNFLEAEWIFERSDGKIFKSYSTVCREPNTKADIEVNEESPWGMGMYFYRYGNNQEAREKSAEMGSKAGIKWTREDFSWAGIEPTPGKFVFDYYDNVVNTGLKYGISTYALLCYWAPWTEPYTIKGVEDFVNYTRMTVQHFKDRVKYWEIYNEPNIFFWQGPKELYPELVKRCYSVIKSIDPQAKVLAISTSGIDFGFIKKCLEAGAPFDILTVHPYRRELNEENFIKELRRAYELIGKRPIWITEMGWSTHIWENGVTEWQQALLLARCYLSALASGVVENISWYDFRNDGNDPFYFEENFGIVKDDFTLKPAYLACTNICTQIKKKDVDILKFEHDGVIGIRNDLTAIVWSYKEDVCVRIKTYDKVNVFNLMGEEILSIPKGKKESIMLKKYYPILIKGRCKLLKR